MLLADAWPERRYSKSTIGRWAADEAAIPKKLSPTLAFELGRACGHSEQINQSLLAQILTDQDKILLDRKTYASLIHLTNNAIDQMEDQEAQGRGQATY